jgi:hypothetical protein
VLEEIFEEIIEGLGVDVFFRKAFYYFGEELSKAGWVMAPEASF